MDNLRRLHVRIKGSSSRNIRGYSGKQRKPTLNWDYILYRNSVRGPNRFCPDDDGCIFHQ